ncbi:MAG: hypothetical protein KJ626_08170 [Verrucomicrobia bacterium]|nr:hypothetical protein [Verrucomicrobiota bacterium]
MFYLKNLLSQAKAGQENRTRMRLVQTSFRHVTLFRSAMRKARGPVLVLILVLSCLFSHPAGADVADQTFSPPWLHTQIQAIISTNTAVEPEPPPPPAPDPDEEALQLLKQVLSTNISVAHFPALHRMADIEQEVELDLQAISLQFDAERLRALMEKANDLTRAGKTQQAIDALQLSLEDFTDENALYTINHRLGTLFFRQANYIDARKFMEAALSYKPASPSLVCNIAAVALTIGDVDGALEKLDALDIPLISERGVLFSVHFNYACAFSLKGQKEKAIHSLMQAASISPQSVYASLGDTQLDAIRNDTRVLALTDSLRKALQTGAPAPAAPESTPTPVAQATSSGTPEEADIEEVEEELVPQEEDYLRLRLEAEERFSSPPFDRALRLLLREPGRRQTVRDVRIPGTF